MWFRGDLNSPKRFETEGRVLTAGLGSLPVAYDIDQDGDMDLAGAEYFGKMGASFAWLEQVAPPSPSAPSGEWRRHVIDDRRGPAIELEFVENFIGDGETYAIGSNHVNPYAVSTDPEPVITAYRIPADPTKPWPGFVISSNIVSDVGTGNSPKHAPGIFGSGDIDQDGDMDLLVSGDGDPRVFVLEQVDPGKFVTLTLQSDFGQAGGQIIRDLNGDGVPELIVSSYDNDLVSIFARDASGAHPEGLSQTRTPNGLENLPPSGSETGGTAPSEPSATPAPAEEVAPTDITVNVSYDGPEVGELVVAAGAMRRRPTTSSCRR